MNEALTPKQQQFAEEYAIDFNATQAAIRAGYSRRTAGEQAARLLANVRVSEAVRTVLNARSERTAITADDVLRDITRIARRAEEEGQLAVALKAHELRGKHVGMFDDRYAPHFVAELLNRFGEEVFGLLPQDSREVAKRRLVLLVRAAAPRLLPASTEELPARESA